MAYFARIEGNRVREILQADVLPPFHPSLVWVKCTASTKEGMIHQNGEFTNEDEHG